jgi:hypothetical protein
MAMTNGTKSGAETGPIPVETRRCQCRRLEMPGASPTGGLLSAEVGRRQSNYDLT